MMKWLTSALLLLSAFVFAGCQSDGEIIATGVKIEFVRIERAGDGSARVTWRVTNPNVVPYLIHHSTHKLTLDGQTIGTVSDNVPLGVPSRNQVEQTTDLNFANADARARLADLAAKGSAGYNAQTSVWFLLFDDDQVKSEFSESGTVPIIAK